MTGRLTPQEQADLEAMEADVAKTPLAPVRKDVRVERFVGDAPGLGADGKLFPVPPRAPAKPRK